MSGYSEDNEVYIRGVKILNHRSNFSHIAHFFEKDAVSECPFSIAKANDYAEKLCEEGLISEYSSIDPVGRYKLTEGGEELVERLGRMLEEMDDVERRLNYQSVPERQK